LRSGVAGYHLLSRNWARPSPGNSKPSRRPSDGDGHIRFTAPRFHHTAKINPFIVAQPFVPGARIFVD
jgi:hypothetical protein